MALYLVTGGAGFIGSHIVEALVLSGERVRVLDNFSTGRRANVQHLGEAEIVEGDIRDINLVRRATQAVDYVIHHAAIVSVPQSMADPMATHEVNVTGTLNVLQAAREFDVQRVVLASSCAVYGDNEVLPLGETAVSRPMSPYATTKLMGEAYCQLFYLAYGVPTTVLRYFNIYGPRQEPTSEYAAVIPKFMQRMRLGQSPVIFGDGLQTRDFVHVTDAAKANLLACKCDTAKGQVLNVASGRGTSLIELVDAMNELLGTSIQPVFAAARGGDIKHSRGDAARLAAALNFRPGISLAEGLSSVMASPLAQTEKAMAT